jgi:hypothetical protein
MVSEIRGYFSHAFVRDVAPQLPANRSDYRRSPLEAAIAP